MTWINDPEQIHLQLGLRAADWTCPEKVEGLLIA
jgi:hypothetical protein